MESEIKARIAVDGTAFRRGMTALLADAKGFASKLSSSWKEILSVSAIAYGIKETAQRMVELRQTAEDVGVSLGFLVKYQSLAQNFGASTEQANAAMMKLAETIGQARTEGGDAQKKFENVGIALYEQNGEARTTEAVFKDVAERYRNTSDAATKAALALEFFGKTGRQINNVLAEGADGVEKLGGKFLGLSTGLGAVEAGALAGFTKGLSRLASATKDVAAAYSGRFIEFIRIIGMTGAAPFRGMRFGEAFTKELDRLVEVSKDLDSSGSRDQDARDKQRAETTKREADASERVLTLRDKVRAMYLAQLQDSEQIVELEKELAELLDSEADAIMTENELLEKNLKIQEKELQIAKMKEREAQKMAKHLDEEEQAIQDVINARKVEFMNLLDKFKASKIAVGATIADRMKYTEEEFANANLRGIVDPETRRQAAIYQQQVMPLKFRAAQQRKKGFFNEAIATETQAQQIMAGLNRMQGSNEAAQLVELKAQNEKLKMLASAVQGNALLTKTVMAP